jgi:hypothetical protein
VSRSCCCLLLRHNALLLVQPTVAPVLPAHLEPDFAPLHRLSYPYALFRLTPASFFSSTFRYSGSSTNDQRSLSYGLTCSEPFLAAGDSPFKDQHTNSTSFLVREGSRSRTGLGASSPSNLVAQCKAVRSNSLSYCTRVHVQDAMISQENSPWKKFPGRSSAAKRTKVSPYREVPWGILHDFMQRGPISGTSSQEDSLRSLYPA